MRKHIIVAVSILAMAGLASCATTRLVSSWRNPSVETLRFHRILVAAVDASDAERRNTEDAMVRVIGDRAVPSYTVFPGNPDKLRRESVRDKVADAGFDGAVLLRKVGAETETTYVPGVYHSPYYDGFWGYWWYAWPSVYEPAYLRTDRIVKIETLVYDLESDKLVWAGKSEAFNPTSVASIVPDIAEQVRREMEREGLLS